MGKASDERPELNAAELKDLREELWVLLPIFVISTLMFAWSFNYRIEAAGVPMFAGAVALIFSGMRLIHVIFPRSKIGEFKGEGLGGEFDTLKAKIKDDLHIAGEVSVRETSTFKKEKKAIIGLLGCFAVFLLVGYLIGTFFVIVGASYYYGFKKKAAIFVILIVMYVIVYVILYKLMGAPMDYGLVGHVIKPLLRSI